MRHNKPKGFQCKQFFVAHDQCAMRVSTDSLILGSFAEPNDALRILDIGTGSGILALMMAQKSRREARILAIDIDEKAILQAQDNVRVSPWPEKVTTRLCALHSLNGTGLFDLIVSNPPYFADVAAPTSAYRTMQQSRGLARTEQGLTLASFFSRAGLLSTPNGRLYCMYPFERRVDVMSSATSHGWYPAQELVVQHSEVMTPYLCVFAFRRTVAPFTTQSLIIRQPDNQYTLNYRALCQDFYLNF